MDHDDDFDPPADFVSPPKQTFGEAKCGILKTTSSFSCHTEPSRGKLELRRNVSFQLPTGWKDETDDFPDPDDHAHVRPKLPKDAEAFVSASELLKHNVESDVFNEKSEDSCPQPDCTLPRRPGGVHCVRHATTPGAAALPRCMSEGCPNPARQGGYNCEQHHRERLARDERQAAAQQQQQAAAQQQQAAAQQQGPAGHNVPYSVGQSAGGGQMSAYAQGAYPPAPAPQGLSSGVGPMLRYDQQSHHPQQQPPAQGPHSNMPAHPYAPPGSPLHGQHPPLHLQPHATPVTSSGPFGPPYPVSKNRRGPEAQRNPKPGDDSQYPPAEYNRGALNYYKDAPARARQPSAGGLVNISDKVSYPAAVGPTESKASGYGRAGATSPQTPYGRPPQPQQKPAGSGSVTSRIAASVKSLVSAR